MSDVINLLGFPTNRFAFPSSHVENTSTFLKVFNIQNSTYKGLYDIMYHLTILLAIPLHM